MNAKRTCKIVIDIVMTVMLLILMARQISGNLAHEWLGVGMFVLFIAHNTLNWNWYRNLLKGRYTPFRVFQTIINFLAFLSMIGMMISGIILSRNVFEFLPISGGTSFARTLHMISAYWGFVLMSMHIGLHWNMLMGMARNALKPLKPISSSVSVIPLRIIAVLIAAYGIYAFIKNQIGMYMFLRIQFVFFDYDQPIALFFADYLAIMGLFIFIAYYGAKLMQKFRVKKGAKGESS